jgi:hypothetical protein
LHVKLREQIRFGGALVQYSNNFLYHESHRADNSSIIFLFSDKPHRHILAIIKYRNLLEISQSTDSFRAEYFVFQLAIQKFKD